MNREYGSGESGFYSSLTSFGGTFFIFDYNFTVTLTTNEDQMLRQSQKTT